jgi:sugar (pentulose or hexulose) kinase
MASVIGIDVGTTGTKGVLINDEFRLSGNQLKKEQSRNKPK